MCSLASPAATSPADVAALSAADFADWALSLVFKFCLVPLELQGHV